MFHVAFYLCWYIIISVFRSPVSGSSSILPAKIDPISISVAWGIISNPIICLFVYCRTGPGLVFTERWGCCNIMYFSRHHYELKSCETTFLPNFVIKMIKQLGNKKCHASFPNEDPILAWMGICLTMICGFKFWVRLQECWATFWILDNKCCCGLRTNSKLRCVNSIDLAGSVRRRHV